MSRYNVIHKITSKADLIEQVNSSKASKGPSANKLSNKVKGKVQTRSPEDIEGPEDPGGPSC